MNDPFQGNTGSGWYDKALKFIEEGRNDDLRPQLEKFNLTINELPFIEECLKNKSTYEKDAEYEVDKITSPLVSWVAIPTYIVGLVYLLNYGLAYIFTLLLMLLPWEIKQIPFGLFGLGLLMSFWWTFVILDKLANGLEIAKGKIVKMKVKRKLQPYHDNLMRASQMKENLDEFIVANEKYEQEQKTRIELIRRKELNNLQRQKEIIRKQREAELVELRKQKEFWKELSGLEFEDEVEKIFIKLGYKTLRTKLSNDGGYDIIIEKDGKRYIVECKHHKKPIGVTVLRALHGVKGSANGCILVSLNGCSKTANEFAVQNEIQILDMNRLINLSKGLG